MLCQCISHSVSVQELLSGPHTRVRVDMATAPVQGGGIVSPKGKGCGGAGRQTGMLQFFKGAHTRTGARLTRVQQPTLVGARRACCQLSRGRFAGRLNVAESSAARHMKENTKRRGQHNQLCNLHVQYPLLLNFDASRACSPYRTDSALGCTESSLRCTLARYLSSAPHGLAGCSAKQTWCKVM